MNWSFLLDWTWATSLVQAIFSKDEAFYWKHIHGSSTFLHNGQPRTGTIIRTDKFNFLLKQFESIIFILKTVID